MDWANQYTDTDIVAHLFNRNPPLNGRLRGCRWRRKYKKKSRGPFNFSWFLKTVLYLLKECSNWKFWSKKIILSLSNKIVKKRI